MRVAARFPARRVFTLAGGLACYALLYGVSYWSSVRFGIIASGDGAAATWVPSGLQVATLLLVRERRWWPFVLVVGAASELITGWMLFGSVPGRAVAIAVGNGLEALLAALLIRYGTGQLRPELRRAREIVVLGLAALTAPAINAALILPALGFTSWSARWAYFHVYWLGDAIAIVALVPVALTLFALRVPGRQARDWVAGSAETGALMLSSVGVVLLVFGPTRESPVTASSVMAVWPVVAWAAFRTGPAGAALLNLGIIICADLLTKAGRGPFGAVSDAGGERVAALQGVLLTMAVSSLVLAAVLCERQEAERALVRAGETDRITGLANVDVARRTVDRARRCGPVTAVLAVDIDSFDDVNKSHGREVGDRVLRQLGERLQLGLRTGDLVARGIGDTFLVVLGRLPSADSAQLQADRVLATLAAPLVVDDAVLTLTYCSGLAIADEGQESTDEVIARAKAALAEAQSRGRDQHVSLDIDGYGQLDEVRRLQARLAHALRVGELEVHYQPILELADLRVVAVEALVRWRHPERGLLLASAFVPGAEVSGLILAVDDWVTCQALADLRFLRGQPGLSQLRLFLNMSARALAEPDCSERFRRRLREQGVPPAWVVVELTETALVRDSDRIRQVAEELSGIGVDLTLDDFGQGHASLARLRALPIRILKIDQAFVEGLGIHAVDDAIVRWTTTLAQQLEMLTVAEGVERPEQLGYLVEAGVTYAQGFLLAEPSPPTHVAASIGPDGRLVGTAALLVPHARPAGTGDWD